MQIFQGELRVDVSALLLAQQAALAAAVANGAKDAPYQPFTSRGAAEAAVIPESVKYITINGMQYVRDPDGTALTTADGGKWSPIGTATPQHFGGNFTASLNAAIAWVSAQGGGEVRVPFGVYALTETVNMATGVTVRVDPGTVINADAVSGTVILFGGEVEPETPLTVDTNIGDETITAAGADFSVGDLIHLVSQRNALSRTDAGTHWLGDGTASASIAYFAEFAVIAEVMGGGQYRLSRRLVFPKYRTNASQETESGRASAAAKRVNAVSDAHWIGGKIICQAGTATVLNGTWANRCTISDTHIMMGSRLGDALVWRASVDCVAKRVICENDPALVWNYTNRHGKMNRFKVVGSQDCGFDGVETSHAAQAVDFTYSSSGGHGPFANLRPFCRNGLFRACYEGLTSHAGSLEEEWANNRVLDCFEDGLVVRGMRPRITGNTFQSTFNTRAAPPGNDLSWVGIGLAYGGYRGAVVSGNTISGFPAAFYLLDSPTLEWQGRALDTAITNNEVDSCYVGLWSNLGAWSGLRNVLYAGNTHKRMGRYMVKLDGYSAGTTIRDNEVIGDLLIGSSIIGMVDVERNNPALRIENNRWQRSKGGNAGQTIYMVYYRGITDTATYPAADYQSQSVISGNTANYSSELMADFFGSSAYPVT